MTKTLKQLLAQPFPVGWIPQPGDTVIVPADSGNGAARRGVVRTVYCDIEPPTVAVQDRVYYQIYRKDEIRPDTTTKGKR